MKLLEKIALWLFDLIDKYIHQRNIINFINDRGLNIKNFIDVGAHKGKYTDLILDNFDTSRAFLIEPQRNIYNYLRNKYKNKNKINIFNFAASNKNKIKKFYINKHDLTSSLAELNQKNQYLNIKSRLFGTNLKGMIKSKRKVKTMKLDSLINKMKILKIDLIKIDTEGHELEVLEGLGNKIKRIKVILIEFHNSSTYLGYNSRKIEMILKKNNFKLEKKIKFPFTTWEDRFYFNKRINLV
jgi:FkbM family methyltransferase